MTRRKDPAEADIYADNRRTIERAHEWLRANCVEPPAGAALFTGNEREWQIKQCRDNPHTMARCGAPADEAPDSRCAAVRRLLLECLAIEGLEERRRHAAERHGTLNAAFYEDSATRDAIPLLEQGLAGVRLLLGEARWRANALETLGHFSDFNEEVRVRAREAESALARLLKHARTVMGVDPPRTLREVNTFRSDWCKNLYELRFTYDEIQELLGYERSNEPTVRARIRDRVRKACAGSVPGSAPQSVR